MIDMTVQPLITRFGNNIRITACRVKNRLTVIIPVIRDLYGFIKDLPRLPLQFPNTFLHVVEISAAIKVAKLVLHYFCDSTFTQARITVLCMICRKVDLHVHRFYSLFDGTLSAKLYSLI